MAEVGGEGLLDEGVDPAPVGLAGGAVAQDEPPGGAGGGSAAGDRARVITWWRRTDRYPRPGSTSASRTGFALSWSRMTASPVPAVSSRARISVRSSSRTAASRWPGST